MEARLAFAIATDVQPDIMILDEVLSVGDESFKNKCKKRIDKFWDADATVLVVSHDLEFIKQSCQHTILLEKGKVKLVGDAERVVDYYLRNTATVQASGISL